MAKHDEMKMEVFRSGDYGAKGRYTDADLQKIADDYQPQLLEAPLTFDHAQAGPAYGWVARLQREGDRLVAVLKGVPDAVRNLVRTGAYKRRSIELLRRMPETGRPYLRAISLLGAATPQVKGLREICFAAAEDTERVDLHHDASTTDAGPTLADLSARLLQSQVALMFADLRADGYHLAERDVRALTQIVSAGMVSTDHVHFGDNSSQPALDWLSQFLRQTLLRAPLGESSTPSATAPSSAAQFSERTLPASLALHNSALRVQADNPGMAYRDALGLAARQA